MRLQLPLGFWGVLHVRMGLPRCGCCALAAACRGPVNLRFPHTHNPASSPCPPPPPPVPGGRRRRRRRGALRLQQPRFPAGALEPGVGQGGGARAAAHDVRRGRQCDDARQQSARFTRYQLQLRSAGALGIPLYLHSATGHYF
jgi:hypothetical protein